MTETPAAPLCRACNQPIVERRKGRKYCSRECFFEATRNTPICKVCLRHMPWGKGPHTCTGPPKPKRPLTEVPASPHRVPNFYALPPRCEHCGGLWRPVANGAGVGCLTCGRDLWIEAELLRLARLEGTPSG